MTRPRLPVVTAALALVAAAVIAVVFVATGIPGEPEGWWAGVGFAAPLAGAGALLGLGTRYQAAFLVVVGALLLVLIGWILYVLIPLAVLATVTGFRHGGRPASAVEALVGLLSLVAVGAAFAMLLFHETPAQWSTDTLQGSSSDIVTNGEATISVVTVVAVIAMATWWGRHNRHIS